MSGVQCSHLLTVLAYGQQIGGFYPVLESWAGSLLVYAAETWNARALTSKGRATIPAALTEACSDISEPSSASQPCFLLAAGVTSVFPS